MAKLNQFILSDSKISGAIPTEIGQLSNLVGLYLGANRLNGGVPSEIGRLTNLEDLRLDQNSLFRVGYQMS